MRSFMNELIFLNKCMKKKNILRSNKRMFEFQTQTGRQEDAHSGCSRSQTVEYYHLPSRSLVIWEQHQLEGGKEKTRPIDACEKHYGNCALISLEQSSVLWTLKSLNWVTHSQDKTFSFSKKGKDFITSFLRNHSILSLMFIVLHSAGVQR